MLTLPIKKKWFDMIKSGEKKGEIRNMDKEYIEVKIPILDSVDEMKVVKTFTQEQLWYVCAIAKAFEKSEQQVKKQKEVIDKIDKYIKPLITNRDDEQYYAINWYNKDVLSDILKEVSE